MKKLLTVATLIVLLNVMATSSLFAQNSATQSATSSTTTTTTTTSTTTGTGGTTKGGTTSSTPTTLPQSGSHDLLIYAIMGIFLLVVAGISRATLLHAQSEEL